MRGWSFYSPLTDARRFLTTDPVPGGGANSYAYPTDPITQFDLSGRCWGGGDWCHPWKAVASAYHQAIRVVAVVPYAVYYGGYQMNKWAAQNSWAAPLRPLGDAMQISGITGDASIDMVKGVTGFHESVWDEHKTGNMNPLHSSSTDNKGTWLPGLHWNNGPRLDFAW